MCLLQKHYDHCTRIYVCWPNDNTKHNTNIQQKKSRIISWWMVVDIINTTAHFAAFTIHNCIEIPNHVYCSCLFWLRAFSFLYLFSAPLREWDWNHGDNNKKPKKKKIAPTNGKLFEKCMWQFSNSFLLLSEPNLITIKPC